MPICSTTSQQHDFFSTSFHHKNEQSINPLPSLHPETYPKKPHVAPPDLLIHHWLSPTHVYVDICIRLRSFFAPSNHSEIKDNKKSPLIFFVATFPLCSQSEQEGNGTAPRTQNPPHQGHCTPQGQLPLPNSTPLSCQILPNFPHMHFHSFGPPVKHWTNTTKNWLHKKYQSSQNDETEVPWGQLGGTGAADI